MPYVSVIVPAYNAASTLPLCLAALAAQDYPREEYEIIVVDDGSSDATAETARAAGVRVIFQPNAGPAAARNRGAEAARGDLLLFTDADCAPTPGWVRCLAAALAAEGVAGAKGTYLTQQPAPVARLTQQEYQDRYDRMAALPSIDFVDTYSAGYHKDLFLANGGFDTAFPTASVEDQEFSFRLAARGYRLVFVPEAQVYHLHNRSWRAYARRKFRIGFWKAPVTRRYPQRLVRDSHTPQLLKVQMALLPVALILGLVGVRARPMRLPAALAAAGFAATTVPFAGKVARRDPALLPWVLPFVALRALALGAGFAAGSVRFAAAGEKRALQP